MGNSMLSDLFENKKTYFNVSARFEYIFTFAKVYSPWLDPSYKNRSVRHTYFITGKITLKKMFFHLILTHVILILIHIAV